MRLWNDHRNFILAIAAGLMVLLGVESWVMGVLADTSATREANRDLAAFVEEQSAVVRDEEVIEEGRKIALYEHILPEHRRRFEYALPEPFALPAGDPNPLFRLRKALESVLEELRERARPSDIALPKGLGFSDDLRDTDAADGLLRLSIVREALGRAIEARVAGVEDVRQEPDVRGVLGAGGATEQVLRAYKVRIVLRGDWAATARFLQALSAEIPYLAVSSADLRTVDGSVRADISLAALRLEDAPARAAPSPGQGATNRDAPAGPKPIRTYRPR